MLADCDSHQGDVIYVEDTQETLDQIQTKVDEGFTQLWNHMDTKINSSNQKNTTMIKGIETDIGDLKTKMDKL